MTKYPKIEISIIQKEDGFLETVSVDIAIEVNGASYYANLDEVLTESVTDAEVNTLVSYWQDIAEKNGMNFEVEPDVLDGTIPDEV